MSLLRPPAGLAGLALVSALVASPAAAATPLNGSLDFSAFTQTNNKNADRHAAAASWSTGGFKPTGVKNLPSQNVDSGSASGKNTINGHIDMGATWDPSGDSGSVTADINRLLDINPKSSNNLSLVLTANWSYMFTADQDGVFNLDYALDNATGDLGDLGLWTIAFDDPVGGFAQKKITKGFKGESELDGSLSLALQAGQTYTVFLFTNDADKDSGDKDPPSKRAQGGYTATFNWSIIPDAAAGAVPEPSAWALMVTGFGLAGGALRRRRELNLGAL